MVQRAVGNLAEVDRHVAHERVCLAAVGLDQVDQVVGGRDAQVLVARVVLECDVLGRRRADELDGAVVLPHHLVGALRHAAVRHAGVARAPPVLRDQPVDEVRVRVVLVEDELPDAHGHHLVGVGALVVRGGVELLVAHDKHRRLHELAVHLAEKHVRVDVLILARLFALLRRRLLDGGALVVARLHVVLAVIAAFPAFGDRRPQQAEERIHVRRARLVVHVAAHVAQAVGVGAEHALRHVEHHRPRGAHRPLLVVAGHRGGGGVGVVGRLRKDFAELQPAAVGLLVVREDGRQDVVVAQALLHRLALRLLPAEEVGPRGGARRALTPAHARVVGAVVVVAEGRAADAAVVVVVVVAAPALAALVRVVLAPQRARLVVARAVGALVVLRGVVVRVARTAGPARAARAPARHARRAAELAFALALHLDFAPAALVVELGQARALQLLDARPLQGDALLALRRGVDHILLLHRRRRPRLRRRRVAQQRRLVVERIVQILVGRHVGHLPGAVCSHLKSIFLLVILFIPD